LYRKWKCTAISSVSEAALAALHSVQETVGLGDMTTTFEVAKGRHLCATAYAGCSVVPNRLGAYTLPDISVLAPQSLTYESRHPALRCWCWNMVHYLIRTWQVVRKATWFLSLRNSDILGGCVSRSHDTGEEMYGYSGGSKRYRTPPEGRA
jgi:hypothetical protein